MSDLVERLNIKAGVMEMGEKIAWGSDTALMREAAAELTRLQKELETAREALEDIASDKLRDDTWPEHYWRLVEVARRALKDKEVAG